MSIKVYNRAFRFCNATSVSGVTLIEPRLLRTCSTCSRYYLTCCNQHSSDIPRRADPLQPNACRHRWLVSYVDGACGGNGSVAATGGIGIARGTRRKQQKSKKPAQHHKDLLPQEIYTSQNVELIAALAALEILLSLAGVNWELLENRNYEHVIVADSEYVVKGVRMWFDKWKQNGWTNSQNQPPANLNLWQTLVWHVETLKSRGLHVAFVHVRREHNKQADALAKRAANNED